MKYTSAPTTTQTTPTSFNLVNFSLHSISMVSPEEGWAVGNTRPAVVDPNTGQPTSERNSGGEPVILHYQQGHWTPQQLPDMKSYLGCGGSAGECPLFALYGISMVSATDGWAVGNTELQLMYHGEVDGVTWGLLLHYTGGKWVLADVHAARLSSIYMHSATDGWIIGQGIRTDNRQGASIALHYDGHAWSPVDGPTFTNIVPLTLTGAVDGEVWISGIDYSVPVGDGEDGYRLATLLHYAGTQWSKVNPQIANGRLYGITLLGRGVGWAVGMLPNAADHRASEVDGVIVHYQNGVWQEQAHFKDPRGTTEFSLTSVAMASPEEGWAVGEEGVIMHYANGTWTGARSPTTEGLSSVTLVSASEGWAIGDHGVILHYQNGAWSLYQGS